MAADTVDTPKTLDNTHRVPVNVVIDQIVAVLQILTLGNAVSGNKNINLLCTARHQHIPPLRNGREAGQHIVQGSFQPLNGRFSVNRPGNDSGIQTVFCFDIVCYLVIQILRRIGKRRENQHLFIAFVDGTVHFLVQQLQEILEFQIVFRRDVGYHQGQ